MPDSSAGAPSPNPLDDLSPNGTVFVFDGKPYVVGVDVSVNAFTTQSAENTDDSSTGKTLVLSVEDLLQSSTPDTRTTLFDEAPHLRRTNGVVRRRTRPMRRSTGRHEARPARRPTRRAGASSASSSADPGDSPGESEPPPDGRCWACGADISHKRGGAKTCDATCRKRLSRGVTAPPAAIPLPASADLVELIDAKARERQAVWAERWNPNRAVKLEDLTQDLEELYGELRIARSWSPDRWPFIGRSASWITVPAAPMRRKPRETRLEAVAWAS